MACAVSHTATASYPLERYYRVGRFMPVAFFDGSVPHLDGAIDTMVPPGSSGIAPQLVAAPLDDSFHGLGPDEKLIGTTLDTSVVKPEWFAGFKAIVVRLDAGAIRSSPPRDWQSLDALVTDEKTFDSLPASDLSLQGVAVLIRKDEGSVELQGAPMALDATPDPQANEPADNWTPARPAWFGRLVLAMGLIFSVSLLGVSLLKPRARWIGLGGCAGLLALCVGVIERQAVTCEATGRVFLDGPAVHAIDTWTFVRSNRGMDWRGDATPMLANIDQAAHWKLYCDGRGFPMRWTCDLPATDMRTLVSRSADESAAPARFFPALSPLREMAGRLYPLYRLEGQPTDGGNWTLTDSNIQWPDLYLAWNNEESR